MSFDNERPFQVPLPDGCDHQDRGRTADSKSYIRGISLATFLQLVQMERKTCTLRVTSGQRVGALYIRAGELLAAETGALSGERAAHEIVCWPEPDIEMQGGCLKKTVQIKTSIEHLLLETCRIEDERNRSKFERISQSDGVAGSETAGIPPRTRGGKSQLELEEAAAACTDGIGRREEIQMNKLMAEIKSLPGVVGGFVVDQSQNLLINNLPSFFNEDRLLAVAKKLQKIHAASLAAYADATEACLFYAESVLILRPVTESRHLVLVCDPGVNIDMLSMSLKLAMENPCSLEAEGAAPETVVPPVPLKPDYVLAGPLGGSLGKIEAAVIEVMGPMGALIFEDALDRWCSGGRVSAQSVPALMDMIAEEIGDANKQQGFRALLGE